jgi:hypothetical protein
MAPPGQGEWKVERVASGSAPVAGRSRSAPRWLIVAAIGLVFLVIIGYVLGGAAAASGPMGRAEGALRTTFDHQQQVVASLSEDPFKNIDFKSTTPDIATAKTALAGYEQRLTSAAALVAADRAALERSRPELQASLLTLPEQAATGRDRRRVDAALAGLASAKKGLDILEKESAFAGPFLDALAGFVALGNATDVAGVQAQLPNTGASLQKAIDLAKPPAIPAELGPMLTAMQRAVTDLQTLVAAAQANDQAAFNAASAALDTDVKAVTGFDQTALDKADKLRFQPMIDSYNKEMKIAAGA